jgi:hypothetical protein
MALAGSIKSSKLFKKLLGDFAARQADKAGTGQYLDVSEDFNSKGLSLTKTYLLRAQGSDTEITPEMQATAEEAALKDLDRLFEDYYEDWDFDKVTKKISNQKSYKVKSDHVYGLKDRKGKAYGSSTLISAINLILYKHVRETMGPERKFRWDTGRFGHSARVVGLRTQGKNIHTQKGVSILFTYMKYPYQTFEAGGAMARGTGARSRDPRIVIKTAIMNALPTILHKSSHKLISKMKPRLAGSGGGNR